MIDIKIPILPVTSPDSETFGLVDFLDITPKITAIIPHGIDINQKQAKTIDIIPKTNDSTAKPFLSTGV